MSTTSVRRLKERGGSGGKITASMPTKSLTPVSEKPSFGSARKSAVKENPNSRSISGVSGPAQNPAIRPVPRLSSLSSGDVESRPRSRPRGRSPSPSDFTRLLSDMRKTRVSGGDMVGRVEMSNAGAVGSGGKGLIGSRVSEKKGSKELSQKVGENGVNGFRVSAGGKENVTVGGKFRDSCEKVTNESKSNGKRLSGMHRKETSVIVNSVNSSVDDVNYALDGCGHPCNKDGNFSAVDNVIVCEGEIANGNPVLESDNALSTERNHSVLSSKGMSMKGMSNVKGLDVCKGKGINEEGANGWVGNKQAGKLHEKLAYLEGKVKRIASDIKKTKEMLDMNNTDASKMILSDIQEKISGIEKAMGKVIVDSNLHVTANSSSDSRNAKSSEIDTKGRSIDGLSQNKQADPSKVLVKGLSCEELEARLFPHHKLLRNRTSLKVSASDFQGYAANVLESNCASNTENSTNPCDEDAIALEFLASLNKIPPELSVTNNATSQNADEVQETEDTETSTKGQSSSIFAGKHSIELDLQADERLDEFDDQENMPAMIVGEELEDMSLPQLVEIGRKTSTGGWFVLEGESVLLAHDDASCSFYDIANHEEKAEYRPPAGISQSIWRDCWIIHAPGADGCSGKYVVAASAGNTMNSGFCSWDFYSKEVQAFHTEDYKTAPRVALGPLPDNVAYRRNALGGIMSSENQQWWYRPCGPLIVSTASCQRAVKVFDIRDGEEIMKWDVQKPVLAMDYSSPLQWRTRGKVVVAETEAISLWDVSSLNPQALSSVSTSGCRISALHVNNTDAELGGGVRQRVSSSEAEGNDGVFCTADSINILDFRQPSGIGLKIPKIGVSFESISSRGDSVFLGCSTVTSTAKKQVFSQVLQFSLRKQRIVNTYVLPESNAHSHHRALTQVWGNSNLVMAVSGLGLFVFDTLRDDVLPSFAIDYSSPQKVREVIGPDDLYSPSFDYISSQVLLISRDRPAMWRHLS